MINYTRVWPISIPAGIIVRRLSWKYYSFSFLINVYLKTFFVYNFYSIYNSVLLRIAHDRFAKIAEELATIFKNDDNCVTSKHFYWPSKQSSTAGGPIYCKYTKIRGKLIIAGVLNKSVMTQNGNYNK